MNIKKAASAIYQNQKQIKAALAGVEMTFAAVEKSLGSAQFLLKLSNNKSAKGTPRGLFTRGTIAISPGQIVIIEGDIKNGFEIVGRIDQMSDAQKLVRLGLMSSDILTAASGAGAVATSIQNEDEFFDHSETHEGVSEPTASIRDSRKKQEQTIAAYALAARFASKNISPSPIQEEDVNIDSI